MTVSTFLDVEKKKSIRDVIAENIKFRKPTFVVGCHNALSAFLAQEAGAEMLWFSGYEYSATMRLPDANILTMNECLNVARTMTDRVSVPFLADCDNGFGNAINAIRTAIEYHRAGFSGICIEDNTFPKRCSFYESKERHLEDVSTFTGKIKAIKDVINNRQHDDSFFLVARTEQFIVDKNEVSGALERILAYEDAGADGVLVHWKETDNVENLFKVAEQFVKCRKNLNTRLFCVPTTYNQYSYKDLYGAGFDAIILANYGIRSCVKAMKDTFGKILSGKSLSEGNDNVVPMKEIFRIVSTDDLRENEERYVK